MTPNTRACALMSLGLALTAGAAAASQPPPLPGLQRPASGDHRAVMVTPEIHEGTLRALRVELRFSGDQDGETRVGLPDERLRAGNFYETISDISAHNAVVAGGLAAERVLTHEPGAPITLTYRVTQNSTARFATMVAPTHFAALGTAIFPRLPDRPEFTFDFTWGPAPATWTLATDLEQNAGTPTSGQGLFSSTLVGGADVVIGESALGEGRFRIAMLPGTGLELDSFTGLANRIAEAANSLWEGAPAEFLVTVAPASDPRGKVYAGLGLGDAYTLYVSSDPNPFMVKYTVAHEYLHTWIGKAFGDTSDGWFGEGFTDYYARVVNLRAGAYTAEDFVRSWNDTLRGYATSPLRLAKNTEALLKLAEGDSAASDLAEDRGSMIAALLDYRLRRALRGAIDLRAVLLAVKADVAGGRGEGRGQDRLTAKALELAGVDLRPDIEAHIERGEALILPADLFGGCVQLETVTVPEYDPGFRPSRAGEPVGGVDPAGPAYAAGLRDGMTILRRQSGVVGDSRVELVYAVQDGERERIIRYRPEGSGSVTFQEARLSGTLADTQSARCMASDMLDEGSDAGAR